MRAFNNPSLLDKCLEVFRLKYPTSKVGIVINEDLQRLSTIDAASIAAACKTGVEVKEKLFQARVEALLD